MGDPGGKESERKLPSKEAVVKNVAVIQKQLEMFFQQQPIIVLNNNDWLAKLQLLDFLRDFGKHFSMTELSQRDFIVERMGKSGSGISFAEFSYSLIQGYDFWHLFKDHGVKFQIGGSDQWGNMLSGVSLVRKKEGKEAHALSMPLIIDKASGKKFGKTEEGAIWLDRAKTSPSQFYQFWVSADDADVEDHLKIFTDLSREEIAKIMAAHKDHPEERTAQQTLAKNVTELVHGEGDRIFAESVAEHLTGKNPIAEAKADALKEIREAIPALSVQPGSSVIETLVQTGLATSNSEARRLLAGGAVYINNQSIKRPHLEASDFTNQKLLLRRGKAFKDSALIELI